MLRPAQQCASLAWRRGLGWMSTTATRRHGNDVVHRAATMCETRRRVSSATDTGNGSATATAGIASVVSSQSRPGSFGELLDSVTQHIEATDAQQPLKLDASVYSYVLDAFRHRGDAEAIQATLDTMVDEGSTPTSDDVHCLVDALVVQGRIDNACRVVLEAQETFGQPALVDTVHLAAKACLDHGLAHSAMHLLGTQFGSTLLADPALLSAALAPTSSPDTKNSPSNHPTPTSTIERLHTPTPQSVVLAAQAMVMNGLGGVSELCDNVAVADDADAKSVVRAYAGDLDQLTCAVVAASKSGQPVSQTWLVGAMGACIAHGQLAACHELYRNASRCNVVHRTWKGQTEFYNLYLESWTQGKHHEVDAACTKASQLLASHTFAPSSRTYSLALLLSAAPRRPPQAAKKLSAVVLTRLAEQSTPFDVGLLVRALRSSSKPPSRQLQVLEQFARDILHAKNNGTQTRTVAPMDAGFVSLLQQVFDTDSDRTLRPESVQRRLHTIEQAAKQTGGFSEILCHNLLRIYGQYGLFDQCRQLVSGMRRKGLKCSLAVFDIIASETRALASTCGDHPRLAEVTRWPVTLMWKWVLEDEPALTPEQRVSCLVSMLGLCAAGGHAKQAVHFYHSLVDLEAYTTEDQVMSALALVVRAHAVSLAQPLQDDVQTLLQPHRAALPLELLDSLIWHHSALATKLFLETKAAAGDSTVPTQKDQPSELLAEAVELLQAAASRQWSVSHGSVRKLLWALAEVQPTGFAGQLNTCAALAGGMGLQAGDKGLSEIAGLLKVDKSGQTKGYDAFQRALAQLR
eukprot:m.283137 g.283137  ORF g.283137 m.283137 type:complete len:803 (+) comp19411_c0_seq4:34-2442(+)